MSNSNAGDRKLGRLTVCSSGPARHTACAVAAGLVTSARRHTLSASQNGQLWRASNRWAIAWNRFIDPSRLARWDNLDYDSFGLCGRVVNDVVYVPAAYVSEALAYCVGLRSAGAVGGGVDREGSLYHCDQTGTGMGMPPSSTTGLPGVLDHVEVRIAFHLHLQLPFGDLTLARQKGER